MTLGTRATRPIAIKTIIPFKIKIIGELYLELIHKKVPIKKIITGENLYKNFIIWH